MQNKYWANEQWNNLAPEVTLESIGASPEVLTGTTAPTTSTAGAVGQFYLDTSTKELYQCMTQGPVYTWQLLVSGKWKLLQAYTAAGSYTFTTPSNVTELGVFIIGGGASGGAQALSYSGGSTSGTGGPSGRTKIVQLSGTLVPTYPVVVGSGGSAVTAVVNAGDLTSSVNGNNGNSSSFNGIVALGGNSTTQAGAQGSSCYNTYTTVSPAFGEIRISTTAEYQQGQTFVQECLDLFALKKIGIAGGFAYTNNSDVYIENGASIIDDYGNHGSSGAATKYVSGQPYTAIAVKGTSYGCGGGGAAIHIGQNACTATSAAGCDGAVLIYGR